MMSILKISLVGVAVPVVLAVAKESGDDDDASGDGLSTELNSSHVTDKAKEWLKKYHKECHEVKHALGGDVVLNTDDHYLNITQACEGFHEWLKWHKDHPNWDDKTPKQKWHYIKNLSGADKIKALLWYRGMLQTRHTCDGLLIDHDAKAVMFYQKKDKDFDKFHTKGFCKGIVFFGEQISEEENEAGVSQTEQAQWGGSQADA
jgi:hypothetical protein